MHLGKWFSCFFESMFHNFIIFFKFIPNSENLVVYPSFYTIIQNCINLPSYSNVRQTRLS